MIPTFIDEEFDYIEANEFIASEWVKRCPFKDCQGCPVSIQCRKLWDNYASKTEDKKLRKSEIIKYIDKKFKNIQITLTFPEN